MPPLYSHSVIRLCFTLIVFALLPVPVRAEPIKLKFAFFASDREFAYEGVIKPFVDAVNLEGRGIVEIELYPGGELGRAYGQQAQLVLGGAADMAWVHPALTPEQFPDNTVIELPGLFHNAEEATQVYARVLSAGLLKGYEDFFPIVAVGTEPLTIHTRAPIASLDDLKDRRIRTSNQTEATVLKALGMEPVMMPINQVAGAINSGAIDGSTAALEALADFGISRFATYHYLLGLGSAPLLILMNRKKFDSLPESAQNLIGRFSGVWLAKHYIESINIYDSRILEKLKSDPRRKVIFPSQQDLLTARKVFDSVVIQWAHSNSRSGVLLNTVETELVKLRSTR